MNGKNSLAIMYFKKALQYAYYLNDQVSEIEYYNLIARSQMDSGQAYKMKRYYERAFRTMTDPDNGICRTNSIMFITCKKE